MCACQCTYQVVSAAGGTHKFCCKLALHHDACCAGGGSTKDAVKAALGKKATMAWGMPQHAPSEEARVQFWVQPALQDPTMQERLQHAWAAVLSPTGKYKAVLACRPT